MSQRTQNDRIAARLKAGDTITAMEALREFGCFRCASRINDLKNQGYKIEKIMEKKNGKHFARYFLVEPKK